MTTIWFPQDVLRPSGAPPRTPPSRPLGTLAANGEWVVPPEARPVGWERMPIAEPCGQKDVGTEASRQRVEEDE